MIVNGNIKMHLSLNVYDLETDAVHIDTNGKARVSNPDKFFEDWCDHWNRGIGELSGASTEYVDIDIENEDDD